MPSRRPRRLSEFAMVALLLAPSAVRGQLAPVDLQVEMRKDPLGIDSRSPRLSWRVESTARGARQTAYRVLVASTEAALVAGRGDRWDSGRVESGETMHIAYSGTPLRSGERLLWRVQVWDEKGRASRWSDTACWSMGLLEADDWKARWISFRDPSPVHADRGKLYLPPARHYRKEFEASKPVRRAVVYSTALGIHELHLNGRRVGNAWFEPGWSDYRRRAYYVAHDVTGLVATGPNCLGAIVADGWYAGYVGYGLLVGYGPNRAGRCFYGKTPALRAQLEIEYEDGSRDTIGTDPTWRTTGEGPIREADLIMGEAYDARREMPGWCRPGFDAAGWEPAIRAEENGDVEAVFSDTLGDRKVQLGFRAPSVLQAYPAPPVRVTEELEPIAISEPRPRVWILDLGQNFAGVVRLRVRGPAGTRVAIRHGEMLHPDGRLMTENLRRARATDVYVLRGDPAGETWQPRFTYHGFRYVELEGLPEKPGLDAVTGLVLHSDTPLSSSFECSDPVMTRFYRNVVWTQRSNFVEVPTDCPQRDERLGWMGDAQIYARTATFHADVAAFFTKWLDDVAEAQRPNGAYPDYCPYPMAHGAPGKAWGTAWMDAGVICPWTVWQVYGDVRALERHYEPMARFLEFRRTAGPTGESIGNPWGDWLNVDEPTPIEYVDLCYHAGSCRLLADMAEALGKGADAETHRSRLAELKKAFAGRYLDGDGVLKVPTQTAHVLALDFGLLPEDLVQPAADRLARRIAENGNRMSTGFLGTKPLLPVLSAHGHHDLAVRLFQSREFPSWGYEVVNGATTVWERWDSYTKEDGFGRHNAAMNSFSHYAFGAVCEWAFRFLAGIDTDGPGYRRLLIRPGPPTPGSNPDRDPIGWVKAEYRSRRGPIAVEWRRERDRFDLRVRIPANTTATVLLPADDAGSVTEGGRPLAEASGVKLIRMEPGRAVLAVESGDYAFVSKPAAPSR